MRKSEAGCPRCAGWVLPAILEGKGRDRWMVLPAIRCLNCGWYGGDQVMATNAGLMLDQLRLIA